MGRRGEQEWVMKFKGGRSFKREKLVSGDMLLRVQKGQLGGHTDPRESRFSDVMGQKFNFRWWKEVEEARVDYVSEYIDHKGTEKGVLPGKGCRLEEELLFVLMGEIGTSNRLHYRGRDWKFRRGKCYLMEQAQIWTSKSLTRSRLRPGEEKLLSAKLEGKRDFADAINL